MFTAETMILAHQKPHALKQTGGDVIMSSVTIVTLLFCHVSLSGPRATSGVRGVFYKDVFSVGITSKSQP